MSKLAPNSLHIFIPPKDIFEVLDNCKINWVEPHNTNDPFENSIRMNLGFTRKELEKAVIARIAQMVFDVDDPCGDGRDMPIQKAIKRWRSENRFHTEDEVEESLTDVVPSLVNPHWERISNYMGRWQSFANEVRLISLYENLNSINAWQLHAGFHKGIAIKFRVHEGCMVHLPKQVEYRKYRTFALLLKDQVEIILGEKPVPGESNFYDQLLMKANHNSDQKEWRLFHLPDHIKAIGGGQDDGQIFEYNPKPVIKTKEVMQNCFEPSEALAIYLGMGMEKSDEEEVKILCKSKFPNVKLFKACPHEFEFAIDFKKV